MKRFFNYFKIPFIVTAVIMAVCIIIRLVHGGTDTGIIRNNESDLTSNVFDNAGVLNEKYIKELDEYIAQIEEEIGCDIAVVTLNESLEGKYNTEARLWVMNYADDFADNHKMGYDKAYGNSIVFLDNIYREPSTGRVYSWISTSGLAQQKLSQNACESIMNDALDGLKDGSSAGEYMTAYHRVVQLLPSYMRGSESLGEVARSIKTVYILGVAFFIALIYVLVNWKSKLGKRTTVSTTYVENGRPNITRKQDIFIRKSVTKRKIQQSSGGSGGHMSSGGHSHGGGGHSR